MINPKKIEQIARKIHELIPNSIRNFGDDLEIKIRQILHSQLIKLDFVSREEFELQIQTLLSTHEKLISLDQRLKKLEEIYSLKKINQKSTTTSMNN